MATPVDRSNPSGRIDVSAVATLAELAAELRRLRRREARLRQGRELTYQQLAGRTGWSATIIGAYLNGAALPPTDRFDTLISLLGAGLDELGPLASARDRVADIRRRGERPTEVEVTAWSPPRELPAPPTHFAGREAELARLDAVSDQAGAGAAVITGMAGVGKTALALRWAHRAADRYPDGQLYIDLRGFSAGEPVDPADALAGFLRSLGVNPANLPVGLSERAARYRTLLSRRRVLVLLDNGISAEQLRPLLPGSPLCTVLVTSRDRLPGLVSADGATRVDLDVLSTEDAAGLLRGLVGDRVDATPDAAASLAAACGHLPLAIRIAAEVATRRPGVALPDLVEDLSDERTRLDTLDTGEPRTAVRTVLSWSYRALSADAAGLFRLFGLAPGPHLTPSAIAGLGGLGPTELRRMIAELDRAHVLVESTPGRYVLHDVLRAYAAELAQSQLDPAGRDAARRQLLDHYLHTAIAADRQLEPDRWPLDLHRPADVVVHPIDSMEAARRWFDTERAALVAAVRGAAALGYPEHAWQLTWALATYLDRTGDWPELAALAALAAPGAVDPAAAGRVHNLSARAALRLGQLETAFEHYRQALRLYKQIGDEHNLASTHSSLGKACSESGALPDALRHHRLALALFRRLDDVGGQAATLNNLGFNQARLGQFAPARLACREALGLARELGHGKGEAHCLDSLGYIHRGLGEYDQAIEHYHRAVALFEQSGARMAGADAWTSLGDTYAETGQPEAAGDAWRFALATLDDLDHPAAAGVRARLATGRPPDPGAQGAGFQPAGAR